MASQSTTRPRSIGYRMSSSPLLFNAWWPQAYDDAAISVRVLAIVAFGATDKSCCIFATALGVTTLTATSPAKPTFIISLPASITTALPLQICRGHSSMSGDRWINEGPDDRWNPAFFFFGGGF